jgi:putative ABC transport system permease protein
MAYLSFRVAFRHFRADFMGMLLSVVAVALGVSLVVAVESMNRAVLQGFLDTVDGVVGRASLNITAGQGITFSEEIVDKIATVPGVALAVPLVRSVTFPDDGSGEMLTVHGVDLTHDADVRLYHRAHDAKVPVIPDALQFLNMPDSIVLGREFADRRGLQRGDTLDLVTPGGVQRFTVRGLLAPEGLARTLRGRLVVMDLYAAERAFTRDGQINQIDVIVNAISSVDATRAAIASLLPAGISVQEPALRKNVIQKSIAGFQAMLSGFSLLTVLAGFVICYSRLGAIAASRTWEVGLLRAVGLRRSAVFVEVLKENVLVGLTGTALGVPVGLLIAHVGLPYLATTTALNFRMPTPAVEPTFDVLVVMLGIASGVGAAVLATVGPALHLSRTRPVTALTLRGREAPHAATRNRSGLSLVLAATTVGLIALQRQLDAPALGIVTTGMIVATAAILVTPLLSLGGSPLVAMWSRLFGPAGRLAAHDVRQHSRRSSLTVITLGLGLGAVLLFGILGWSFERTLVARLLASERSDLVISSAFVTGGYRTAPLSEELLSELRAVPGIAIAAGEQSNDVVFGNSTIELKVCDAACFLDDRIYAWPLEPGATSDANARVASGQAVLVTTAFAREFGSRVGDTIELPAPNGRLALPIAGISSGAPQSAIWLDRDVYKRLWNDATIWTANVALERGASYDTVERAVLAKLGPRYRLAILSSADLMDYFVGQVREAFSLQYLLEAITLLLVAIAIGDTLASSVLERTRELGVMRAIGLRRSNLFNVVMLEGLAISSLGQGVAVITGLALGVFWVTTQFPALLGWDLDLHIPITFIARAMVITIALCAAGSLLPALRAARRSAVEALRHE